MKINQEMFNAVVKLKGRILSFRELNNELMRSGFENELENAYPAVEDGWMDWYNDDDHPHCYVIVYFDIREKRDTPEETIIIIKSVKEHQ